MEPEKSAGSLDSSMDVICRFAGHLAHEINNLLTPIIACSQMLRDGMKEDDNLYFCAEQVCDAGERCLALSRKLQRIGSSRSGGHILELAPLISEAVQGAVLPADRTIRVVEAFAGKPGLSGLHAKIDLEQFMFLVGELIRNAVDAMPRGGDIRLDLERQDSAGQGAAPEGWVVLSVADQGTGMTPEVQARMYEPFFTTRGQQRDKGLGLTMAYGIVRRAGGRIECESQPGQGTTFRVYLPPFAGNRVVST